MMQRFNFPVVQPDPALEDLRTELQAFLREELKAGNFRPEPECWMASADPEFSRKMGQRGWIGLTWSKQYGGQGKSALERYIVIEETLRAGAPVGAHWIADRQHAPMLLEHGTEEQKLDILPRIAAGEVLFRDRTERAGCRVRSRQCENASGEKSRTAGRSMARKSGLPARICHIIWSRCSAPRQPTAATAMSGCRRS